MMRSISSAGVLVGLGLALVATGCGDDSSGSGGGGGEGTTSSATSSTTTAAAVTATASTTTAASSSSGEGGSAGEGGSTGDGGGAAVADWDCLADPPDAPQFINGPAATIVVRVRKFLVDEGITDATVRVCEYTDIDCENPVDEGITDADGEVEVDVPTDSRHYVEASGEDLATTLSFSNGPVDDGLIINFLVLTLGQLDQFIVLAGGEGSVADPARGHIGLSAEDCNGVLAAGVELGVDTADEDTLFGYFGETGFPTQDGTETTADGRLGVANVPVGEATITGTLAAGDEELGVRTVFVRAGAVSYSVGNSPVPQAIE